ncbi:MAG: hypothetical protein ACXAD7_25385, partial [Candidatus Kariarchaeaceae archaeon]
YLSNDIFVIKNLLEEFNIKPNEEAYTESKLIGSPNSIEVLNNSEMGKSADEISYLGNYLDLIDPDDPSTNIIAQSPTSKLIGVASHDIPNGGRIVVSSSNKWLDNCAIEYPSCNTPYPGGNEDKIFLNSTFAWLSSKDRLSLSLSTDENTKKLKGIITNTLQKLPEVTISHSYGVPITPLVISNTNDTQYKIEYEIPYDSTYKISIHSGGLYYEKQLRLDIDKPVIDLDIVSGKEISSTESVEFRIHDNFLDVVTVKIDGNLVQSGIQKTDTGYWKRYSVDLSQQQLQTGQAQFTIEAHDLFGHQSNTEIQLRIISNGDVSTISNLTETTSPTSVTEVNTVTNDDQNKFTVSRSTQLEIKHIFILGLIIPVMYRTRRKREQQTN